MITGARIFRSIFGLSLIVLSILAASFPPAYAASYNMNYHLTYTGVPFAGGAIVLLNNFTNTGQLTIRVANISFASDFWPNGTRVLTSGLLFNLTASTNKEVDTSVLIPTSTSLGTHTLTATASWQFANATGWHNASPITTSTSVTVSQTISSLFASFATILIIGLVVAAIIVALVVAVVVLKKRKSKQQASQPTPSH